MFAARTLETAVSEVGTREQMYRYVTQQNQETLKDAECKRNQIQDTRI